MSTKNQQVNKSPGTLWLDSIQNICNVMFSEIYSEAKTKLGKINIDNNHINTEIVVNNFDKFSVDIRFTPLAVKRIDGLINYFKENPLALLSLADTEYYSNLTLDLREKNLNILPDSIDDIEISCSCGSVKCNHIALILQNISKKISKNPSLLFKLRGINPDEMVLKAGFIDALSEICLNNQFRTLGCPESDPKSDNKAPLPVYDVNTTFAIIDTNPSCFPRGSSKQKIIEFYNTILSEYDKDITYKNPMPIRNTDFYLCLSQDKELKVFVTPVNSFWGYIRSKDSRMKPEKKTFKIPILDNETGENVFKEKEGFLLQADFVFEYFMGIINHPDQDYDSETLLFFKRTVLFALKLVRAGAFLPEIFPINDTKIQINYTPLLTNSRIKAAFCNFCRTIPEGIIFDETTEESLTEGAGFFIISRFITFIVERLFFLKPSLLKKNNLLNIFVKNRTFDITSPTDKTTAFSLHEWLKPALFPNLPFKIILRLEPEKTDNTFNIRTEICFDNDVNNTIPLSELFSPEKQEIKGYSVNFLKTKICGQLLHAAYFMPSLKTILDKKGLFYPVLTLQETSNLILNLASTFNQLGINILAPKELQNYSKVRISLKVKSKSGKDRELKSLFDTQNPNAIKLEDLLDFSYEIALGNQKLSREEFLKLVDSADSIVRHNGQYFLLNEDEITSIVKKLNNVAMVSDPEQLMFAGITGIFEDFEFDIDEALKNALDEYTRVEDIDLPQNLAGILRPYQERGYRWLYSNYLRKFGSCIADDMGLGKTIQVLSLILRLKEEKKLDKPVLVVCPTTLLGNWVKECEKFAPALKIAIYHGNDRSFDVNKVDVLITNYSLVRIDSEKFKEQEWSMLVIDEAQNIKNPSAGQSQAIKSIKAANYIAMTGTPVENSLSELWSIFDFLNKGYLGSRYDFQNTYTLPIEKFRDEEKIKRLKKVTSPFVLRRLKTDKTIITDLPEKNVIDEYCYLTKEQAAIYEKTLQDSMSSIKGSTGINRNGNIFKLITALKQICNHPVHYKKGGELSRESSGKADTTLTLIENIIESNEKAIIFSQYKEMGNLLVDLFKKEMDQKSLFFHGSLSREEREELITKFQEDDECKLMVLSLKAGGTGLNLTKATNVIHYDLWWNPAVEEQATDRVYRIGQTKNVNVYRLISLGTFEEKIDAKIKSKKELAELTIGSGEKWLTELSDDEIKDLFSLSQY